MFASFCLLPLDEQYLPFLYLVFMFLEAPFAHTFGLLFACMLHIMWYSVSFLVVVIFKWIVAAWKVVSWCRQDSLYTSYVATFGFRSFYLFWSVRNLINPSSPKRATANLCTTMLTHAKVKGKGTYFRRDCVFVQNFVLFFFWWSIFGLFSRCLQRSLDWSWSQVKVKFGHPDYCNIYFCSLFDCFPLDLCLPTSSVRVTVRSRNRNRTSK